MEAKKFPWLLDSYVSMPKNIHDKWWLLLACSWCPKVFMRGTLGGILLGGCILGCLHSGRKCLVPFHPLIWYCCHGGGSICGGPRPRSQPKFKVHPGLFCLSHLKKCCDLVFLKRLYNSYLYCLCMLLP